MDFAQPIKVTQLAEIIGARVIGDAALEIMGLNELHVVREGDISFVDHPKYYEKVLDSKASAIIINKEVEVPENKTLLLHDAPFDAFIQLIGHFRPFMQSTRFISPSANIGQGTIIQPGAFIGNHVSIGKNCIIHANVSIYDHSVIGDEVIIHSGTTIGSDGFYFQKRKKEGYIKFQSGGRVILEDRVEIGASCSIDRGVTGDTIIGWGTKMDNQCQVGHDTVIGKNCLIGAFAAIAGVTVIEDDVVLWARVAVNKDVVVGKGAVLYSTTGVDKSIDGNKAYMGAPATEARKYWRQIAAIRQMPDLLKKIR